MLKFLGWLLLGISVHACVNAIGVWIILEQFDYSLPNAWSYIFVGYGLSIVLNGNLVSTD